VAKFFVTGGAGFIGSTFADSALEKGHDVVVYDNFETGLELFLTSSSINSSFKLIKGDIRDLSFLTESIKQSEPDWIVHLAANADIRQGLSRPKRDLEFNTLGTWNIAEASRLSNVKNILFSSTGSVYGEPAIFPTPETCSFPVQTSLYGASKIAGEGILSAYSAGYGINCVTFRFVSILGARYTHGHVFDFMKSLLKDSSRIDILGDGKQLKSYLHIKDLIKGLWTVIESKPTGYEIYNIGHDDTMTVDTSVSYITREMNIEPQRFYSGGTRGWIGDSPRIQLDCTKLKKLGWHYSYDLETSVKDTVRYLLENKSLFNEVD